MKISLIYEKPLIINFTLILEQCVHLWKINKIYKKVTQIDGINNQTINKLESNTISERVLQHKIFHYKKGKWLTYNFQNIPPLQAR